ncbi:transcription factor 7 [Gracilaria domingensis]|nr:transcription factor 7 [Gracilaria domingensis]
MRGGRVAATRARGARPLALTKHRAGRSQRRRARARAALRRDVVAAPDPSREKAPPRPANKMGAAFCPAAPAAAPGAASGRADARRAARGRPASARRVAQRAHQHAAHGVARAARVSAQRGGGSARAAGGGRGDGAAGGGEPRVAAFRRAQLAGRRDGRA